MSPYFFNAGLLTRAIRYVSWGNFTPKRIIAAQLPFDMLFGPAYKGIPLVSTIAIALAEMVIIIPSVLIARKLKIMEKGRAGRAPLTGRC